MMAVRILLFITETNRIEYKKGSTSELDIEEIL